MKSIFKNLGKSPSLIHQKNIFEESLKETKTKGSYEQSVKDLSPLTYQESNLLNFEFAKWFALVYHFISALLGLATVVLLSYTFSGLGTLGNYPTWLLYAMFALTLLILTALLVGIEIFKSSLAKSIFKKVAIGEKNKVTAVFGLGLVMLFSILVSAVGGAILSYSMNDKSTHINQSYSAQVDSLGKLHNENLQAVNASIEAYKANLNKGSYWAKYHTRQSLDKAIERRNELLQSANSQISTIQTAKEKEMDTNTGEGFKYALISAVVVLFLEILSILSYWYQYQYHANCEREAVNFEILPVSSNQSTPVTNDTTMKEIKELLQNVLQGNNQLQIASSPINTSANKVGFSFGANKDTTVKVNGEGNTLKVVQKEYIQLGVNERICKHCNSKFNFKHWNATYCGEKCKIEAWEKKTGKKFNKKKGGAK